MGSVVRGAFCVAVLLVSIAIVGAAFAAQDPQGVTADADAVASTRTPSAPPGLPPDAACPTSEFVVYYEWDGSVLNASALETIDAALARARNCQVRDVTVVGHTDTAGPSDLNQALSERRASIVRDALVARGIGADAVEAFGRGETDLARATRDGTREPLNRRSAMTINYDGVPYLRVPIISQTATAFHFIRGDLWTNLAQTEQTRLQAMVNLPDHGPYTIGDPAPLRINSAYRVFPVCAGTIALRNGVTRTVDANMQDLQVSC
jgi:outer membrane protein OmpA-like peptidoglycan-associated protein